MDVTTIDTDILKKELEKREAIQREIDKKKREEEARLAKIEKNNFIRKVMNLVVESKPDVDYLIWDDNKQYYYGLFLGREAINMYCLGESNISYVEDDFNESAESYAEYIKNRIHSGLYIIKDLNIRINYYSSISYNNRKYIAWNAKFIRNKSLLYDDKIKWEEAVENAVKERNKEMKSFFKTVKIPQMINQFQSEKISEIIKKVKELISHTKKIFYKMEYFGKYADSYDSFKCNVNKINNTIELLNLINSENYIDALKFANSYHQIYDIDDKYVSIKYYIEREIVNRDKSLQNKEKIQVLQYKIDELNKELNKIKG